MTERVHSSPEQDFYTELQENVLNGLEELVSEDQWQKQHLESQEQNPELQERIYENLDQDREPQKDSDQQSKQVIDLPEIVHTISQLDVTVQESDYQQQKIHPAQQENIQDSQDEDIEEEDYTYEQLNLYAKLKEHARASLSLKKARTRLKAYFLAKSTDIKKTKKRKLVTRLDIAFLTLLIVLGAFYISIPGTSPQSNPGKKNQPASSSTHNTNTIKGMGGVDVASQPAAPPKNGIEQDFLKKVSSILGGSIPYDPNPKGDWLTGNSDNKGNYTSGGIVFQTDPYHTFGGNQPAVNPVSFLFNGIEGIVETLLVLVFIVVGYRVLAGSFGFRYASALEMLPRTILAVAAVALSDALIHFVVDLNNALCNFMIQLAYSGAAQISFNSMVIPAQNWLIYLLGFVVANVTIFIAAMLFIIPGVSWIVGAIGGGLGFAIYLATFRWALLAILSIMLGVQLVMRLILLDVFIILSPIAIVCWAFPNPLLQGIARSWCMSFFKLVFVQFIQVACIAVGVMIIPQITLSLDVNAIFTGANLFGFIGPIAVLWLAVRIPRIIGSSALSTVESAGTAVGRAISGGVVN